MSELQSFSAILTVEDDCYGIGDGCLIDVYAIGEFNSDCNRLIRGDKLAPLSSSLFTEDEAATAWLDSFVGQTVTVDYHDKVFAVDGTFLGIYYC